MVTETTQDVWLWEMWAYVACVIALLLFVARHMNTLTQTTWRNR